MKPQQHQSPEHFLVRKLDKEFLVKVDDIDWLESSGNYVNLHSKKGGFTRCALPSPTQWSCCSTKASVVFTVV